jgi:hypothetical protein
LGVLRDLLLYGNALLVYLSSGVLLLRWGFPAFFVWPLACLLGFVGGVLLIGIFFSLPAFARADPQEQSFTVFDYAVPHAIACAMLSLFHSTVNAGRIKSKLPPFDLPEWLPWVPVGLLLSLLAAHLITRVILRIRRA